MAHPKWDVLSESYPFIEQNGEKLLGKVTIVTGASGGIGKVISKQFAAAGAHVALVGRRESDLNSLVGEITNANGTAVAVVGDISKRGGANEIIHRVEQALGPVDILVNNAGITRISPLIAEDEDLGTWWRVYEVNVKAPAVLIRQVLPGMIERKSGIVLSVSSSVATLALPAMCAYNSSKAALSRFHEGIATELEGTGVLSFAVHPGEIASGLGTVDGAFNRDAVEHPAVQKFIGIVQEDAIRQTPEIAANTIVTLCANERCKVLHGRHINCDQDLEAVLDEAEKDGLGRIGSEDLYLVRIGAL